MAQEDIAPDFEAAPLDELASVLPAAVVCELATSFYDSVASCLSQIEAATQQSDWTAVKEQAHDLKGISGTFGASRLQQLAGELEHAVEPGRPRVVAMLQDMQATFAIARREINRKVAVSASAAA